MATAALVSARKAVERRLAEMAPSAHLRNSTNQAEIFLVGVSHVSRASAALVQQLIKDVKPDVVAVELCKSRFGSHIITGEVHEKYKLSEFFHIPGSFKQKILTYSAVNSYAAINARGIEPGAELRIAVEEGRALGAKVALIDQPMEVTFERAALNIHLKDIWAFWRSSAELETKYPRFLRAMECAIEGMPDETYSLEEGVAEMSEIAWKYFPQLMKVVCEERNEYMVKELRKIEGSVVGVVGGLHVHGLRKLWYDAEVA